MKKDKPEALIFGFNKAGFEKVGRSARPTGMRIAGIFLIVCSFTFGFLFLFASTLAGISIFLILFILGIVGVKKGNKEMKKIEEDYN